MMEVNSPVTGRRGISLPFTDECAVVCQNREEAQTLTRAAMDYAAARRWRYLEFRGGGDSFPEVQPSAIYFGHTLALRSGPIELFAQISGSARTAVRKAEREGVVVSFYRSIEAMRSFYRLLCKTRKRHGIPPQPQRFFDTIHRYVVALGQGAVVLAKKDEVPVAGAVFFHHGNAVLFKFGASDDSRQQLRGNSLLMWRAIEWYAKQGFASLDFGRTSLFNEGLRRFKQGWGAHERSIAYSRYDCRIGDFVTAADESSGWHTRLFRLVPSALARLAGAVAYPHIA